MESKLYIIPMVIIYIVVISMYYGHYENTIEILESEYNSKISLIEKSIYNETKYTEIINEITEKDLKHNMERSSEKILEKYEMNPNVLQWDFKAMKNELNQMDIYILNEELTVIGSSVMEEIGLNFNEYPEFSKILKQRLQGSKFESDTTNFSIIDGKLKKYSYMPTPDNKYLIELSICITKLYPELKQLNIVYLAKELKDKYPFVEDIRVYKFNTNKEYSHELTGVNEGTTEDMILKKDRDIYVKSVLESNEAQEYIVEKEGNIYKYKYIPYVSYHDVNKLTWWESYVIEIIYNDQIMIEEISYQKKSFFRSIIIISILYFGFSYIISYLIQKNYEIGHKDHLTDLPNRKTFEEVMKYEIAKAKANNSIAAILFFDLDNFKKINDLYGHGFGDKVLQEVANRLKVQIRKGDIISRLGGDEFIGLITELKTKEEVVEIAERIADIFESELRIESEEIFVKASLGISIYPNHGNTIEELILKADKAMYDAKRQKLRYRIWEDI